MFLYNCEPVCLKDMSEYPDNENLHLNAKPYRNNKQHFFNLPTLFISSNLLKASFLTLLPATRSE